MSRSRRGGVAAFIGVVACALVATPSAASAQETSTSLGNYLLAAQAPVFQGLEDADNASFHPQGEGEFTYAEADMDPGHAHALSSVLWPGGAAGNAGSLLAVLGVPGLSALNDPVKAEVSSGAGPTSQTLGAGPDMMSSSIQPSSGNTQQATAQTNTVSATGVGGSGTSLASLTLTADNTLKATATSTATGISIGGVIDIGSLTSSATATSANASAPSGSTSIRSSHFTVGGQGACVDNAGVHMGDCGQQSTPMAAAAANQALKNAGMQIYFTEPRQVKIANTTYDYAASVIVVWVIPADPEHDTFTITMGGAAVSAEVTSGSAGTGLPTDLGPFSASGANSGGAGGGAAAIPTSPSTPTLALPTGGSSPALATSRTPSARRSHGNPQVALRPLAVSTSHGIGAGWIVLLVIAAALGAAALPRLPDLLSASAQPVCPDEASGRK